MPRPPSTLQHFSWIAQSSGAILSILVCDLFVSTNVFLCNDSAILIKTSGRDHTSLWFKYCFKIIDTRINSAL